MYSFIFDGSVSLISEVELKIDNVDQTNARPETPGAPGVTTSDGLLTLHWIAVQGAENYEVYISTAKQPPSVPERTVAGTTAVLTGLVNETIYYVWIKAVNRSGSSDFSPFSRGIPWPNNKRPATPERPVIIPGINQITVNWEECGGAASYEVFINTSTTKPSEPVITTDKTSAVIKNLQNGDVYYIWVRAVNSAGKSDYSQPESGIPTIPTRAPAAPSRPVLTTGSHTLTVSWQAVEIAAAYEVWYGTTNNSDQAQKFGTDIAGDVTETVISGLIKETVYYVWIKAKNIVGTSGFSPAANAKPSAFAVLPETPSVPSVTVGNHELSITWQSVEGVLSYEVWTGLTNNPANAEKYGADVSGTSTTLTGLVNGTAYYIWIKAKNNIGVSELSPRASGTPSAFAAAPPAPQAAPAVIDGSGQLTVSWQAVEGANLYEVWAGTSANSSAATKRGGDISGLSAVITGLTNGTTYYVWIKAKNTVGASGFSPAASGTPSVYAAVPQTPAVPSVNIGNGQITVTWSAVEGATAYEVWMATVNNSASASKNGADVSASLSATISGLTNGTTYYIWIKAKNTAGTSGFSPVASAKPIANMGTVTLTTGGSGQLVLNWSAVAGADQYEVYYSTANSIPGSPSQTVSTTTATISSLTNGTAYYVWVKPKNANGTGGISTSVNGKPIGTPGAPTVSSGYKQLQVTWTAVTGADEYEVYYGTTTTPTTLITTTTGTTATITGLTNGTTYYVRLRAKNATGVSGYGQNASETPGNPGLYRGVERIGNQNLANSLTYISSNAVSGDEFYIVLGSDEDSPPVNLEYYSGFSTKTVVITLLGYGSQRTINLNADGILFTIRSGVTLTLDENITLVGRSTNNSELVFVSGGSLIMNDRTKITRNNNSTSLASGGVRVELGTFTMNGGEISGNNGPYGGGVRVGSYGTFTMNGGEIFGNTASLSGGGVNIGGNNPTFTKTGGTITGYASDTVNGNVVKNGSGVVQSNSGHAVYVDSSKRREATAGPGVNMDSSVSGAPGGWEN